MLVATHVHPRATEKGAGGGASAALAGSAAKAESTENGELVRNAPALSALHSATELGQPDLTSHFMVGSL